jgi:O-Antigen ligase
VPAAETLRERVTPGSSTALPGVLAFAAVGLTAAVNGGYFPTEWGWPTLVFALTALVAVLVRERITLGRLELLAFALLAAFVAWTLISVLWSSSATAPVLATERTLVYVTLLPAVFLTTSRRSAALLPAGVLAAAVAVSVYALATRLAPGHLERFPPPDGYQLAEPIGYWNGLGILAALGAVLAFGFAAAGQARWVRVPAAASIPLLLTTLYFTFSRGSWLALVAGLCIVLALERRRLRFLAVVCVLAPPAAVAVLVASRSPALTHAGASRDAASAAGAKLAGALLGCLVAAAAAGWAFELLERRVRLAERTRFRIGAALVGLVLLACVGAVAAAGGPVALVHRASDSFHASLPQTGGDLNRRLVSLSGDGRSEYWRVAEREIEAHPWLGGGAGSYERYWHRERRVGYEARNAHNLYLEMLAELGPIGLVLLLAALATPFLAVRAARAQPPAMLAAAAYGAFLVHAALDWDWQLPAITLAGLLCAAAVLVSARRESAGALLSPRVRAAVVALALPFVAFAIVEQVGNNALAGSRSAADRGKLAAAERLARRAHTWAPWSFEPWQALGEAQLAAANTKAARASFLRALRIDDKEWSLWYELAEAGSGTARAHALAVAARLNPRSPEVAALRSGR